MSWKYASRAQRENVFDWLEHLQATLTDIEADTGRKLTAAGFYQLLKATMLGDAPLPYWAVEPYVDPERLSGNKVDP